MPHPHFFTNLEELLGLSSAEPEDSSQPSSLPPEAAPSASSPPGGGGDVQGSAPLQPAIDQANERREREEDRKRQEKDHAEAQAEVKIERERSEREHQEDLKAMQAAAQPAPEPAPPAVPGSTSPYGTPATVLGPPGPGGVVPREYTTPGGGLVRIGAKHAH